jgi:hypothetical protein
MRQPQILPNMRAMIRGGVAMLAVGLAVGMMPLAALAQTKAPTESAAAALAADQKVFASASDAAAALIAALQADDTTALLKILGPGGEKLVVTGDPVAAKAARESFLASYQQSHVLETEADGSVTIVVGDNAWPMPIPIVEVDGHWQFDSTLGAQVIIDRQIGRNELLTIQTLFAAVLAQKDYYDRMQTAGGAGFFAQYLYSAPGTQNGLYWAVAPGEEESPLGPLVAQAQDEGYPGVTHEGGQVPYHGYYFRLLKAQGPDSSDGAKDYIHDGKMTGGFAYVAWPSYYGRSGIMTFIVNQDGNVFQKDLGPDTGTIAKDMTVFNPDLSWSLIQVSD